MAVFRIREGSVAIVLISSFFVPLVLAKSCKKINNCKCEMDDGSGVIDLSDIDNKDGKPRFKGIPDTAIGSTYTYNYNPCTPIESTGDDADCKGANLCQEDTSTSPPTYYPCDESDPTFTVEFNHVIMTYKTLTHAGYTRTTEITLVCDENSKDGNLGNGITQVPGTGSSATYTAELNAKSACPVASSSSGSSLSTGSILLIIFFPLVLLYLIIGILFNIYIRHKQSVPEVLPNHTFWADFPFLVKDGCVFSCGKMKYCCCVLYHKTKRQEYGEI